MLEASGSESEDDNDRGDAAEGRGKSQIKRIGFNIRALLLPVNMLDSLSSTQDLESQTDENTTPVQKQKSAKLAFEGESVDIATTTPVKVVIL